MHRLSFFSRRASLPNRVSDLLLRKLANPLSCVAGRSCLRDHVTVNVAPAIDGFGQSGNRPFLQGTHSTMRVLARLLSVSLLSLPVLLAAPSAMAQMPPAPAQSAMPPAGHASFTPQQRAEIVEIVRQALVADPSILRDAVAALQADDGARQAAASSQAIAAHHDEVFNNAADPVAGNPKGDVTLVEFYDTRCPYCRGLVPTMDELLKTDHGVRLIYKDIPILGPTSELEARALLAAQRQGGYLALQDVLMHATALSTPESLKAAADRLGMDGAKLLRDMNDPAIQARIDANVSLARTLGVEGTPALVIGQTMIPGAIGLDDLRKAVAAVRAEGPNGHS
jgi:protein-disulfide isomerase